MEIRYTPTECKILKTTAEERLIAARALSVRHPKAEYIQSYKDRVWDGRIKFLKYNVFPSGLLPRLQKRFKREGLTLKVVERVDLNIKWAMPEKDFLDSLELRDNQIRMTLKALLARRGILKGATASGKTAIIALIIACILLGKNDFKPNFLVLSPAGLVEQTRNALRLFLGIPIGVIHAERLEWARVMVASIETLRARLKSKEMKKYFATVHVEIIDETHHLVADTFQDVDAAIGAPCKFGVSATPLDKDQPHLNMALEGMLGPIVDEITLKENVSKGYSSKPHVYMYSVGEDEDLDDVEDDDERYLLGAVFLKDKLKLIRRFARHFVKIGRSTLILVERIIHGETIELILRSAGLDARFLHAQLPPSTKRALEKGFVGGKFPVMIATRVFGEGKDAPIIRAMILAAENAKARVAIQNIGRLVRLYKGVAEDVPVIDVANLSCDMLLRRSLKRIKAFKAEKGGIVLHKLDEEFPWEKT